MPAPSVYQSVVADVSNSPLGGIPQIVDPLGASRVCLRPLDYTGTPSQIAGGHYRATLKTGATTVIVGGTAQPIVSIRWTNASYYFVLLGIRAWANINVAFTNAQIVDLEAFKLTGFTTADSAGTAVGPFTGVNQKMRTTGGTAMATSLVSDFRVATTTNLTVGTRTIDSAGFAIAQFGNSNALGNSTEAVDFYKAENYDYPLMLAANEGIAINPITTQGAVGKVVYYFAFKWAEVLAF